MKYWSKAWSLIEGCNPVSEGCKNCWSASMTYRFQKPTEQFAVVINKGESPRFTGHIRIREDRLDIPRKTKKPTVFSIWNDLLHEQVPEWFLEKAFDTMTLCDGHTFLVLTKKAKRMRNYVYGKFEFKHRRWISPIASNVYIGVSVEDQGMADVKIPFLLQIPCKKFISVEPMLSEINFRHEDLKQINQVICGGETGHNARPCNRDWVRNLRDQCKDAGVPFFFKGWGNFAPCWNNELWYCEDDDRLFSCNKKERNCHILDGKTYDELAWRKGE